MNLSVQYYSQYNSISRNVISCPAASFGSRYGLKPAVSQKTQPKKIRLKFADFFTKLSLYFYHLAEKSAQKKNVDTKDPGFESAKLIRALTRKLNNANWKIDNLNHRIADSDTKIVGLQAEVKELNNKIDSANNTISGLNSKLNESDSKLKQVIQAHENREIDPVKKAKIYEEIKTSTLNYNPMMPYLKSVKPLYKPEKYTCNYEDIKTGTSNRADMVPLDIPEINFLNGSFEFELPKGEMKVKKVKLKEFFEPFEVQSNISDKYSNSLVWNTDKIVRDLLQNFFDGHGQTLDGVKFIFTLTDSGKYKVRIEGKSTYNYKEAVLLGESSSHDNINAAGNYGEGLKMVTLKLLVGNKADDVKIGSGNWEVTCGLKRDDRLDSDVMNYKITPVKEFDGNFIEFETSDKNLLDTIRVFINRFYHSSNLHFKEPDFENDLFGIKVLPNNEKGGLYIAGQQFEYGGRYNNIRNGVIFIKEKIPAEYYDTSRDRVSITHINWAVNITEWLEKRTKNTEDCKKIIKSLEPLVNKTDCAMYDLLEKFVNELGTNIRWHNRGAIKFPDNYLSNDIFFLDNNIRQSLESNGYKLYPGIYKDLGMRTVSNILAETKQHEVFEPTEKEKQKILIVKRALNMFSNLNNGHFSKDELDTKIYIFDRKSAKENSVKENKHIYAEAITDDDKIKGFYIDKKYLDESNFATVLETALHELSHKLYDDGTKEFGYKLTDVNADVFAQIFANPKIAEELCILNDIWNDIQLT